MFDKTINNYINNKKVDNESLIEKINNYKYLFGLIIIGLGIIIQLLFLDNYFENFYPSILYINIDFSIILILLLSFILLSSLFIAYFGTIIIVLIIVIIFIITIYQKIFIGDVNINFLEGPSFLIGITIISFLGGLLLMNYQKKIKEIIPFFKNKIFILIILLIYISFTIFSLKSLIKINYEIEYKTKTGSGTGKVIFYNGENYFLETNEGKKILPVQSIEIINKIGSINKK